jgi:hypothetical protein
MQIDIYAVSALIALISFVAYALIAVVLIPALDWPWTQKFAFAILVGYDAINGAMGAIIVVFGVVEIGESPGAQSSAAYVVAFSVLQLVLGWTIFIYGMKYWRNGREVSARERREVKEERRLAGEERKLAQTARDSATIDQDQARSHRGLDENGDRENGDS